MRDARHGAIRCRGDGPRIGVDFSAKTKGLVYAIIDTENVGKGRAPLTVFIGVTSEEAEGGGVVLAGLSGSPLYSGGPNQYTERQMRRRARALSIRIRCRILIGRPKPRIFVTHSPPFGLGDQNDVAHVGFKSFVDLIDKHEPSLWLHGHVHLYGPDQDRVQQKGETKIVNVFGHRILEV